MGSRTPSRYHLTIGSGLPPELAQDNSNARPSVATGLGPGEICGGLGGVNTVIWKLCEWISRPVPAAFNRHSNFPLSLSYVELEMSKS